MPPKKKSRRVRGDDGKLYEKEELEKLKISANSESSTQVAQTEVTTKGKKSRASKGSVQEKVPKSEKDNSPVIIVSYTDSNGKRISKQFTCDQINLTENCSKTLQRSGPKTVVDIYIEASVIETM